MKAVSERIRRHKKNLLKIDSYAMLCFAMPSLIEALFFLNLAAAAVFTCNGPSMEPTLFSKNILLTERITAHFNNPHRGEIIIAVSPVNPNQHICKRIVGLPGDKIVSNISEVNSEKQTKDSNVLPITEKYVPRGYVWIEGDNNKNSSDSRYYGPIPIGLVKSRVVCRVWPLSEMKLLLQ